MANLKKETMQTLINQNNATSAQCVLINNGFNMISSWFDENEFEKDGIIYGIGHPIWNGKNVNIYIK